MTLAKLIRNSIGGGSALISVCLIAQSAQAITLNSFTDRAAWEAALPAFTTETFNSVDSVRDFAQGRTVDMGEFTITGNEGGIEIGNFISPVDLVTGGLPENDIDGSPYVFGVVANDDLRSYFDVLYDEPITAFGFDFMNALDSDGVLITVDGQNFPVQSNDGFLGVIATDGSFQNIRFDSEERPEIGAFLETFGADNFSSSIVPEPSTAVLIALGLVGLAARRRRS